MGWLYFFVFYGQFWKNNHELMCLDFGFIKPLYIAHILYFFQNNIIFVLFFEIFSWMLLHRCILKRHKRKNIKSYYLIFLNVNIFTFQLQKPRSLNQNFVYGKNVNNLSSKWPPVCWNRLRKKEDCSFSIYCCLNCYIFNIYLCRRNYKNIIVIPCAPRLSCN